MPLYQTKIVRIEARVYDGSIESNRAIIDWAHGSKTPAHMSDMHGDHQTLYITTLEGEHKVTPGDYVICGLAGEFYPCKPDIFNMKYEGVSDDS